MLSRKSQQHLPLIGDEIEYADRGQSADPYAPHPFLRVPLMPWLARISACFHHPIDAMRLMMLFVNTGTYMLTVYAAGIMYGDKASLTAGALLMVMPERFWMSSRFWPEALIGLWLATLPIIFLREDPQWIPALLCGVIALFASLTRIEQILLSPGLLMVWYLREGSVPVWVCVWICAPVLLGHALWTLHNFVKYRLPLPDNTWCFNLTVMQRELQTDPGNHKGIQSCVLSSVPSWQSRSDPSGISSAGKTLISILKQPSNWTRQFLRRAWSLTGPDTFVSQLILSTIPERNRIAGPKTHTLLRIWLHYSVPVMVSLTLCLSLWFGTLPPFYLLPCGMLFLIFCMFHTRTRFRSPLLPSLALWITHLVMTRPLPGDFPVSWIWPALLFPLLTYIFSTKVRSEEGDG
ncbi:MAG: hypothetical protein ACO3N7_00255 [Kiritimatiellia bacterium]